VPTAFIHAPWTAPADMLRDAGVVLGRDYPYPIVDHRQARERFLMIASAFLR
jgi:deoxyribodipyrimidine photo-lyase